MRKSGAGALQGAVSPNSCNAGAAFHANASAENIQPSLLQTSELTAVLETGEDPENTEEMDIKEQD